ncbi:dienelactone hydrolase family protein [Aestuariivirga litoralis]|uniref:dienelactone hydrolase family protein n=1 Tax=Aestuariivirga litoralis TaxID=2650924 RepID=UPI0018C47807|nr:dienelactone hydrolase family protein [Aestuariivirga litoralis]MBG1232859.1 dienelactone hydrolase family protein [Aestuariivirga litoralis]
MDQKYINLFDTYTHGGMNRRDFLDRLKALAGAAAVTPILAQLENNYAHADTVAADDPRLVTKEVQILPDIYGLLAMPKDAKGKLGAVMVIHENRGLNPHIQDIVRRVALEGFVVFGTDYLSLIGRTPQNEDKAREMIGTLKPEDVLAMSMDVRLALSEHEASNGKVGAVGFCWGGGAVNALAVADPDLNAGVAYYGMQVPAADVPKIKAPLLLQNGGLDERVNAGIKDFEAALKAGGKTYELYVYEGANHAFNNDTNPARYNKEAADLAWGRTIGWFKKYLA